MTFFCKCIIGVRRRHMMPDDYQVKHDIASNHLFSLTNLVMGKSIVQLYIKFRNWYNLMNCKCKILTFVSFEKSWMRLLSWMKNPNFPKHFNSWTKMTTLLDPTGPYENGFSTIQPVVDPSLRLQFVSLVCAKQHLRWGHGPPFGGGELIIPGVCEWGSSFFDMFFCFHSQRIHV